MKDMQLKLTPRSKTAKNLLVNVLTRPHLLIKVIIIKVLDVIFQNRYE